MSDDKSCIDNINNKHNIDKDAKNRDDLRKKLLDRTLQSTQGIIDTQSDLNFFTTANKAALKSKFNFAPKTKLTNDTNRLNADASKNHANSNSAVINVSDYADEQISSVPLQHLLTKRLLLKSADNNLSAFNSTSTNINLFNNNKNNQDVTSVLLNNTPVATYHDKTDASDLNRQKTPLLHSLAYSGQNKNSYCPISVQQFVNTSPNKQIDTCDQNITCDKSIFHDDKYIIIQFPGLLPALNASEVHNSDKSNASTPFIQDATSLKTTSDIDNKEKYTACSINTLPEGHIGKLLVRRSGKMQIQLGTHVFDITKSDPSSFAQEVGCITRKAGEIALFPCSSNKFIVTPEL